MPYWAEALSVTARVALWCIFLPYLLMPRTLPFADRVAFGFGGFTAAAVLLPQVLSGLRIYEPLAVWALVGVGAVVLLVRRNQTSDGWSHLLSAVEGLEERGFAGTAGLLVKRLRRWAPQWVRRLQSPNWPVWVVGLAVTVWATWLRYHHYLHHAFFGASDAYVHLAWLKYLERLEIFREGIYPYGYHAFLSALGLLSFVDRALIVRFIGPFAGLLLVLSVLYAATRLGLRPGAAVAAMAIIGLGFGSPLPLESFRQTQPLPQEFAAIFVLPGFAFAARYVQSGNRLAGLGLLLAVFIPAAVHQYALLYLAVAVAVLVGVSLVAGVASLQRVRWLVLGSAAATVLAFLPLGAATLLGLPWHGTLGWAVGQVRAVPEVNLVTGNIYIDGGFVFVAGLLVWGSLKFWRRQRPEAVLLLSLGITLLLFLTQAHGGLGLPVVMEVGRSRLFYSLFLVLALGVCLNGVLQALRLQAAGQAVAAALLVALLVTVWQPRIPHVHQYEYDEAVDAYMSISRQYSPKEWTIVSPVEQYSQVLNVGWHEDLAMFVSRVDVAAVSRPNFQLYIPTPDVFVFVEKLPLYNDTPISPDAVAELPAVDLNDTRAVRSAFYTSPEGRRQLQQRVWGLMEVYQSAHPDKVTIHFDSPHFRVYRIHHQPRIQRQT